MKSKRTNSSTLSLARVLRKNLTPAERRLWTYLRNHQVLAIGFRRQHAIGTYITDFCAPSIKLIIEVDGSQHLGAMEYEQKRTRFLSDKGYQILRFWNNEISNDIQSVILKIIQSIEIIQ